MRIPWYLGAPGFLAAVVIAAFVANYLGANYFKRTLLEESNPLAAAGNLGTPAASTPAAGTPVAGSSPTAPPQANTSPGAVVVSQGKFRDGDPGHRGSGAATLGRDASGKSVLVFEGFSVTNGPDLHVILGSSTSGGGQGLDLGKLKATDGTFSYTIPDGADLAGFRSVTIWCASFPTVFAVAELEKK